jgi:hypothetical protein
MKIDTSACICSRCILYSAESRKDNKTNLCESKQSECPSDSHDKCICLNCSLYKGFKFSGCNFCANEA